MQTEISTDRLKELIRIQLPEIIKKDHEFRRYIIDITKERYAKKEKTQDNIERILDELKRDREKRDKKWEAQEEKWKAQNKKWEAQEEIRKGQDKKWEAQEEIRKAQDKKWEAQEEIRKAQDKKWEAQEEIRKAQDKKWEAQDKRWEAQNKKWEAQEEIRKAQDKRWEAQDKRWELWEKKWEEERKEQAAKWEAQDKRWEENQKVINKMLDSITALDRKYDSTLGALGARWGLHSESSFRNGMRSILEEISDVTVERYQDFDHEGQVFGRPEQIELDLIIRNGTIIICELKSSMSISQMYSFWRKKEFYEDKHNLKVKRTMVISPMVDEQAARVAEKLEIEVYSYSDKVKL